ncbi:hypothetical protein D3C72_1045670 [compost metagenome]
MRIAHALALRERRHQVAEFIAGQHAGQCLEGEMQAPAEFLAWHVRQRPGEGFEEAPEHRRVVPHQVGLDERRGVRIHPPEQAQEGRTADLWLACHLQRGHKQRAHHVFAADGVAGPAGLAGIEERQPPRVERIQPAAEHRLHHHFLAAEVVVDGCEIDDRPRRDLPQGGRFVAHFDEQLLGRIQDPRLGIACRAFAGLHGVSLAKLLLWTPANIHYHCRSVALLAYGCLKRLYEAYFTASTVSQVQFSKSSSRPRVPIRQAENLRESVGSPQSPRPRHALSCQAWRRFACAARSPTQRLPPPRAGRRQSHHAVMRADSDITFCAVNAKTDNWGFAPMLVGNTDPSNTDKLDK